MLRVDYLREQMPSPITLPSASFLNYSLSTGQSASEMVLHKICGKGEKGGNISFIKNINTVNANRNPALCARSTATKAAG